MIEEQHHCNDILSHLSDYIDGELDQSLCHDLEQHLKDCTNCQVVLNTIKKTIDLYRKDSNSQEMSSDMRMRLFASLKLERYKNK